MTKVKIISGTTDKGASWLDHRGNFCGNKAILCSAMLCLERQLIGAQVKKVYFTDNAQYIIPLCQQHNQSDNIIGISDNCILVSADPKETCEKAK